MENETDDLENEELGKLYLTGVHAASSPLTEESNERLGNPIVVSTEHEPHSPKPRHRSRRNADLSKQQGEAASKITPSGSNSDALEYVNELVVIESEAKDESLALQATALIGLPNPEEELRLLEEKANETYGEYKKALDVTKDLEQSSAEMEGEKKDMTATLAKAQ